MKHIIWKTFFTFIKFLPGKGIVVSVNHSMAYVLNDCDEKVICPILTWMGGNNGNLFAESLTDVVETGQMVCSFYSVCRLLQTSLLLELLHFRSEIAT